MKKLLILFGFIFLCGLNLTCNSNEVSAKEEEKTTSRILSEELKEILPELIKIQNITLKESMQKRGFDDSVLYSEVITTENFLYLSLSSMDCEFRPHTSFVEKFNSHTVKFMVDTASYKSERYFDLKGLNKIPVDEIQICDDWSFIQAKFELFRGKLKLTKISSFFDNTFSDETFYDKQDSTYLYQKGVLMIEPEPEPKPVNQL